MVKECLSFQDMLKSNKSIKSKKKKKNKKHENIETKIAKKRKKIPVEIIEESMNELVIDNLSKTKEEVIVSAKDLEILNNKFDKIKIKNLKGKMTIIPVMRCKRPTNSFIPSTYTHCGSIFTTLILYKNKTIKIYDEKELAKKSIQEYYKEISEDVIESIETNVLSNGLKMYLINLSSLPRDIILDMKNTKDEYMYSNFIDIFDLRNLDKSKTIYHNLNNAYIKNKAFLNHDTKLYCINRPGEYILIKDIYDQFQKLN